MALIASQTPKILRELPVLDQPYPYRNQAVVWSAGNWWVLNAEEGVSGSGGRETSHINRYSEKGVYLGRMTLLGAGHGSVFAMDGTTVLVGWDTAGGDRYVRKVAWTKGRKVSESEATLVDTNTGTWNVAPLALDGEYLTLRRTVDLQEIFYQRLYKEPGVTLRTMYVPRYKSPNNTQGYAMQGAFSFGRNLFVQWGWSKDRPHRLDQFEWGAAVGSSVTHKKPLSSLDVTKFGLDSNDTSIEPEGIAVYNGKLIIGKQLNGHSKRTFRVLVFNGVSRDAIVAPKPPPTNVPPTPPWPPTPPPKPVPPTKCGAPPVVTTGLTGASGAGTSDGKFGVWRGTPVTTVGTWINDPAIYPFGPKIDGCDDCGMYETWSGAADIGITPAVWQGWDAEAAGVNDDYWREIGNNLQFFWSQRQRGAWYLRPYYEANGDWFEYAINDKASAFKTAFARTTAILREEFPESQIMFGVACSTPGTGRPTVSSIWPADTSFDALSLDFYNTYPWVNTVPAFNTKIASGAGVSSLEPLRVLAQQHGKPVVISEWGSASVDNGGGGGDAPEFFTGMRNWISANQGLGPGQVLMDVYFNVTSGYPEQYWLWNNAASARQPLAAAQYATLW